MFRLLIVSILIVLLSCNFGSYVSASEISGSQRLECSDDCESMIKQLKKFSKNGSPQAQTILALSYKSGELLDIVDEKLAWKWMKRARNQQYPPALYYISQWYRQGYSADADISQANKYLERSADKNYPPAILDLGILFIQNDDKEEGLRLIQQAANSGSTRAKKLLDLFKGQTTGGAVFSKQVESKQTLVSSAPPTDPDNEVITILGNKLSPMHLFENILVEIDDLNIYDRRGTTGSRLGDTKCGQLGSGCRVIYFKDRGIDDISL